MRASLILSGDAGLHRFVWDLHYPPPPGVPRSYPIAATPYDTAPEPKGPWVVPGTYTVRLTVNGKPSTQPLTVRMDPRIKSGPLALREQFTLSKRLYDAVVSIQERLPQVTEAQQRTALTTLSGQLLRLFALTQDGSGPAPVQTAKAAEEALSRYQALLLTKPRS
jgi:hypothetical protein